jgi:hypothetical protein
MNYARGNKTYNSQMFHVKHFCPISTQNLTRMTCVSGVLSRLLLRCRRDWFCRMPGSSAEGGSRGEETLHAAFERRQPFVHFDNVFKQLFQLLALASDSLLEQNRLFDRLQGVANNAHTHFRLKCASAASRAAPVRSSCARVLA